MRSRLRAFSRLLFNDPIVAAFRYHVDVVWAFYGPTPSVRAVISPVLSLLTAQKQTC
jgi:hypothetical protein